MFLVSALTFLVSAIFRGSSALTFGYCQLGLILGALCLGLGTSLMGLAFLDPLGKCEELRSVGAKDPEIVGAVARFKSDAEQWADESRHLWDFFQVIP